MNFLKKKVNFKRLKYTIDKSSEIGKIPGNGLRRLALSDEDKEMRDLFKYWMKDSGLAVRVDDFGNMYGRREGDTNQSPIVVGSHLDTQPSGGRFDGILGVLIALEAVRTLNDYGIETTRPIEIVNFTNEEGARFEPPMMASGGLAGTFSRDFIYTRTDREGKSYGDELTRIGYDGKQENRLKDFFAFIELHIEQGPVLEKENISIGAVEGIQGTNWLEVTVTGESDHAGPTPMDMRKDALTAASKMVSMIENKAKKYGVSATVGRFSVSPDVVNCVPGEVVFSLDLRHLDNDIRITALNEMKKEIEVIAANRDVSVNIKNLWDSETAVFNNVIVNMISETSNQYGYSVKRIPSGAGHDAKYMNDMGPTAMVFLPSVNGKSHDVSELTLDKDIEQGADVVFGVIQKLANYDKELG
nr:M20 family metallo-hydrolase [Lentibacillus jeotgali]